MQMESSFHCPSDRNRNAGYRLLLNWPIAHSATSPIAHTPDALSKERLAACQRQAKTPMLHKKDSKRIENRWGP
jgi:hypothetical protein